MSLFRGTPRDEHDMMMIIRTVNKKRIPVKFILEVSIQTGLVSIVFLIGDRKK